MRVFPVNSRWLAQLRLVCGTHVQYNAKRNYRWRSAFLALPGSPVFENSFLWMSLGIAFRRYQSASARLPPHPGPLSARREGENNVVEDEIGNTRWIRQGERFSRCFPTVYCPFFYRFPPFLRFSEKPPETRTARSRRRTGADAKELGAVCRNEGSREYGNDERETPNDEQFICDKKTGPRFLTIGGRVKFNRSRRSIPAIKYRSTSRTRTDAAAAAWRRLPFPSCTRSRC